MQKEDEIKILDQIEVLIKKLMNAKDSYFKTFIPEFVPQEDIGQMSNNIRNDFPIMLGTKIESMFDRAIPIYKKRCNILAKIVRSNNIDIFHYHSIIDNLEKEVAQMRDNELGALQSILVEDSMEELLKYYDIKDVVMMKIEHSVALTKNETNFLKERLS